MPHICVDFERKELKWDVPNDTNQCVCLSLIYENKYNQISRFHLPMGTKTMCKLKHEHHTHRHRFKHSSKFTVVVYVCVCAVPTDKSLFATCQKEISNHHRSHYIVPSSSYASHFVIVHISREKWIWLMCVCHRNSIDYIASFIYLCTCAFPWAYFCFFCVCLYFEN